MNVDRIELPPQQTRVVVTLTHDQSIVLEVLVQHIPGSRFGAVQTTDTQSLTLPVSVVHQPGMPPDHRAGLVHDIARLVGQIVGEKRGELALAYKADAGAVFFGMHMQPGGMRKLAYFGLVELAHRKQTRGNLCLAQLVKEVALILVVVEPAQELPGACLTQAAAHVVTGCDRISTARLGVLQEGLELDFPVAEDIGIGCAPGLVFGEKVLAASR